MQTCERFQDLLPSTAQEKTETVEKAVDCLRIITTGNDANKRALVEIPIALKGLMRLLLQPKAVRMCTGTQNSSAA